MSLKIKFITYRENKYFFSILEKLNHEDKVEVYCVFIHSLITSFFYSVYLFARIYELIQNSIRAGKQLTTYITIILRLLKIWNL